MIISIIINNDISPTQIKNLQKAAGEDIKIIDRLQIRISLNKYDMPKQAGLAELATEIGKDIGANLVLLGNYTIIGKDILIITKIVKIYFLYIRTIKIFFR